ncbi:PaaI family thioesterase [Nocardia sp. NPDC058633]|uniref:PaaI family thioesterase n=1 Tax=Nocardia sp. NPDC058633 TaxID=3346568 RepID=UPI003662862E
MTTSPPLPRTGSEAMRLFLPQSPFVRYMGIELVDLGEGSARLRMPFREELVTVGDMVHGGALAGCVDIGIMAAAWAGARLPEHMRGVTVSMSIDFVQPAHAESIDIVGTRLRAGRHLSTCRVDIVATEDGRLIAAGSGTYKVG